MSAKTTLKSIDAEEFEVLASHTRLTEGPKTMARMVLVEGKSGPEVAAIFNVSKQRVSLAVASIRKVHEAKSNLVGVPESLMEHLQLFLTALRSASSPEMIEIAVGQVNRALVGATEFVTFSTTKKAK